MDAARSLLQMEETGISKRRYSQQASSADERECLVGQSSNRHADLITSIYDAALDPALWQHCYDEMRSILGAESTLATLQDPSTGAALLACNMDPRFVQEYADEWWQKDIWAIGVILQPRSHAFIASDIVPDPVWMRSEIFNELVRPLADCRHCLGTVVDVDGALGVMGFHRPSMASNFTAADRRRLQGLVPHIQRALRIGQQLERAQASRRAALAALDALSFGLLVVDGAARPILLNRKAESYLQAGDGLLDGHSGRALRSESLRTTAEFQRSVREAATPGSGLASAIQFPRRPPQKPLTLLISPLIGRQASLLEIRRPSALILVLDPDQEISPDQRLLRTLFGLTSAEAIVARRLALGERLEDIAVHQRIKLSTVRSHLKSLLAKTDTDRQSSLVRLLTRLSVNNGNAPTGSQ